MSLSDGFEANHGENGLLGVVRADDGARYGVYYREPTSTNSERVVLLDVVGTTHEEEALDGTGRRGAYDYADAKYEWVEMTDLGESARDDEF